MTNTNSLVLALDLAMKSSGVAIGSPERGPYFWTTFKTDNWHLNRALWCQEFWNYLHRIREEHAITHVAYEETFIDAERMSPEGTKAQQFFTAVTLLFCQVHGIKIMPIPVNTWRAFFLPGHKAIGTSRYQRRRQNKQAAVDACIERGWEVTNHDEADAVGILCCALVKVNPNSIEKIDPIFKRQAVWK